jgi:hypothetical protein
MSCETRTGCNSGIYSGDPMMPQYAHLDGFDPLAADDFSGTAALSQVFEDSRKRDVQNILKSYTGTFDLFSELLQNSLDAVQARQRRDGVSYEPTIGYTSTCRIVLSG